MKTTKLIGFLLPLIFLLACQQKMTNKLLYIEEEKPSTNPMLFAKDFISKDTVSEYGSIFNKAGDEFFFGIDKDGKSYIKYTRIQNGKWIEPIDLISDEIFSFNDPMLSMDEQRLYYISDKPINAEDTIANIDIWYSEKIGRGWSDPIHAGNEINSLGNEYYISFSADGSMYFSSNRESYKTRKRNFDIYKSQFIDGEFLTPVKLDEAVNTEWYEADVYVSPDESYIIFCSVRRSGLGRGDLYISFKDENGLWSDSISMGTEINSDDHELCPFVTHDGKYFFYTTEQDIYWVSTDVIKNLKKKVFNNR